MALPERRREQQVRLYDDGIYPTADGRANFVVCEHRVTAESPSSRYPLHLITGRLRDQWHGMSRTGIVPRLYSHESEPLLHMHPTTSPGAGSRMATWSPSSRAAAASRSKVLAATTVRPASASCRCTGAATAWAGWASMHSRRRPSTPTQAARTQARRGAGREVRSQALAGGPVPQRKRRRGRRLRSRDHGPAAPLLAGFPYASLTLAGRETPVVVLKLRGEQIPPRPSPPSTRRSASTTRPGC